MLFGVERKVDQIVASFVRYGGSVMRNALIYLPRFLTARGLFFQDAVKKLNSLQTNAQVLAQIRASRGRLVHNNLPEMRSFTERAGVKVSSLELSFPYSL